MPKLKYVTSFNEKEHHLFDDYKNLGYEYEKLGVLKNVVSDEMFGNKLNDIPLRQIELLIVELVNQVKQIKLHYNLALPKNTTLLN